VKTLGKTLEKMLEETMEETRGRRQAVSLRVQLPVDIAAREVTSVESYFLDRALLYYYLPNSARY